MDLLTGDSRDKFQRSEHTNCSQSFQIHNLLFIICLGTMTIIVIIGSSDDCNIPGNKN